jgi:hypothetical protein
MNTLRHCVLLAVSLFPLSCLAEQCAGGSESDTSGTASATTDSAGHATALAVRNIAVRTYPASGERKGGRALVVVEDNTGSLVPGAEVTGTFSGTITENDLTAMTGPNGSATIDTRGTVERGDSLSIEFCVTRVTGAGLKPWGPTGGDGDCARLQTPADPWTGERFLPGHYRGCHSDRAWMGTWPTACHANNRFSVNQRRIYRP